MVYAYPVKLKPDDGSIMVTFPDLPEAVTYGQTREEALMYAVDGLMSVLAHRIDERLDIPSPSKRKATRAVVELPPLAAAKVALYQAMGEQGITKAELARKLDVHGPQVDRLLDLYHASRLEQVTRALAVLGKRLVVDVCDAA